MIKKKKISKDKLLSLRLPKACDESIRRIARGQDIKASEVYRKAIEDLIQSSSSSKV